MTPHPSGRPIKRVERRDYSMASRPTEGFRLPRLRTSRERTEAIGFTAQWPDSDLWHGMEAKR
jgi:hypothetical protein